MAGGARDAAGEEAARLRRLHGHGPLDGERKTILLRYTQYGCMGYNGYREITLVVAGLNLPKKV